MGLRIVAVVSAIFLVLEINVTIQFDKTIIAQSNMDDIIMIKRWRWIALFIVSYENNSKMEMDRVTYPLIYHYGDQCYL